jgi:hypothetical protein
MAATEVMAITDLAVGQLNSSLGNTSGNTELAAELGVALYNSLF